VRGIKEGSPSGLPFLLLAFHRVEDGMKIRAITGVLCLLACAGAAPAQAATCDSLANLALKDATITSAQLVGAGQFTAPGGREGGGANPYAELPPPSAACRRR
jgi:hypothetical protein